LRTDLADAVADNAPAIDLDGPGQVDAAWS